jgi:hypothetical protein
MDFRHETLIFQPFFGDIYAIYQSRKQRIFLNAQDQKFVQSLSPKLYVNQSVKIINILARCVLKH